jgi:hypothetical protein
MSGIVKTLKFKSINLVTHGFHKTTRNLEVVLSYTPTVKSNMCFFKCMMIWAYRHLIPAIPISTYKKDYYFVQAHCNIGEAILRMETALKPVTDEVFRDICKKYMVEI